MYWVKCLVFIIIFSFIQVGLASDCTPLVSPVKYKVQSNDHIASILRYFNLSPVFCKNCSLDTLLSLNQLENQNLIQPNQYLKMPFRCEQDLVSFKLTSANQGYRLIDLPRRVALSENWRKSNDDEVVLVQNDSTKVISNNPLMHFGFKSTKDGNNKNVVFVSELNGVKIENGKNDWSKIDCPGIFIDGNCFFKLNSMYFKFKNNFLSYTLKDNLRNENESIQSVLSPGLVTGLYKNINKLLLLHGSLGFTYQSVTSSPYTIEQNKHIFLNGLFEIIYQPSDFYFGLGLSSIENAYYVPTQLGDSTESVVVRYISPSVGKLWISSDQKTFATEFRLNASIDASRSGANFKNSLIFGVQNEYRLQQGWGYYLAGINFFKHLDNTESTQQSALDLSLLAGMGWNFKTNY